MKVIKIELIKNLFQNYKLNRKCEQKRWEKLNNFIKNKMKKCLFLIYIFIFT